MKVLIIEDENLAAEKLERLLKEIDPSIEVTGMLETVKNSVEWLQSNQAPDLIFMDIQLDDGICFEIFEKIKIKTPVIFTTAYDQYAIRAFKVNGVDYLLKPISKDELSGALAKYKDLYEQREDLMDKIDNLHNQLVKAHKSRFMVKLGTHFHSISTSDIVCFYIQERSTFIKTRIGKNFDIDYSLDQVQSLVDPEQFFRINRNYIINIDAIADIVSYSSNRLKIVMKNFEHLNDLIVSRDKAGTFKAWLDR